MVAYDQNPDILQSFLAVESGAPIDTTSTFKLPVKMLRNH